jgi:hypothetical protein
VSGSTGTTKARAGIDDCCKSDISSSGTPFSFALVDDHFGAAHFLDLPRKPVVVRMHMRDQEALDLLERDANFL